MVYIDTQTLDHPLSERQIRAKFPQVSFPKDFVPPDGFAVFRPTDRPAYDPVYQDCHEATPMIVESVWTQVWEVYDLDPDTIAKNQQEKFDNAAELVRAQRDALLRETDWMALSDNTLTPEWAGYRQALRDVTTQEGFPFSVTWPTEPGVQA